MKEKEAILSFLKNSKLPVKTGDLERNLGIDRNTVQKVINQLAIEGYIKTDTCYNKIISLKGEKDE